MKIQIPISKCNLEVFPLPILLICPFYFLLKPYMSSLKNLITRKWISITHISFITTMLSTSLITRKWIPTWTQHHPSTNHNSPYGRVMAFVVPLYVAQDLFCVFVIKVVKDLRIEGPTILQLASYTIYNSRSLFLQLRRCCHGGKKPSKTLPHPQLKMINYIVLRS